MSQRYRITRLLTENNERPSFISLEECRRYFATMPEFSYTTTYTVKSPSSEGIATISIEGDFFLWSYQNLQIPFRLYDGDLYVSGTHKAVIPMMNVVAQDFGAVIVEG